MRLPRSGFSIKSVKLRQSRVRGYFVQWICPGCMCAKSPQLCSTLCNPMDWSPLGPLSMEFSRKEYWNGLPCPPPGESS